ncbi:MAG: hypothetical protein ACE5E8_07900 [Acidimicrobiia bacterium]
MSATIVTIDAADAIEIAELVAFVETWLAQAGPAVVEDFEGFAAPYTVLELRAELVALAASLGVSRMEQR